MNWDNIISFVTGFFVANIINLIEVSMLVKITKDIKVLMDQLTKSMKEFKLEGEDDKWLK